MTEQAAVKTKINEAIKWWWDSFEMGSMEPAHGVLRCITALVIGIVAIIMVSALLASIVEFIISIRWHLLIAALIAIAYFQTPKYTWGEVFDYVKGQVKLVLGGAEQ